MALRRWRDSLAPPLLAAAALAAIVVPTAARPSPDAGSARAGLAVIPRGAPLDPCRAGAARAAVRAGNGPVAGAAWYRLDPVVDSRGWLTGQRLVAGRVGERGAMERALPVESFVSGPRGGRLLVGADDGRRSTLRIVDVAGRCETTIHAGPELIRRAVLMPNEDGIVELRLDRASRTDRGIWLRPRDGSRPTRIVDPLPANDRLGRIFSTTLQWSSDGRTLTIGSCGEAACLVRLVEPGGRAANRTVTTIDDPGVGEVIGVVGRELVAYGGCATLPCSIVARNLDSGRTRVIAKAAGLATVTATNGGAVAFEDYADRGRLTIAWLRDGRSQKVALDDGLRIVPPEARALAALETGPGVFAVARGGRPATARVPATFVDAAESRLVPATEVVR
jgi:hypothetical protein